MSTPNQKRGLIQARADAEAFRNLFTGRYDQWDFAGSLRRGKPEVGDIEHVIIPRFEHMATPESFFGEDVNLVFHKLDELVAVGTVTKHMYGTTGFRWGQKYRGVDFRGFNHELFIATPDNWGSTLAIRTGPADFSTRLVKGLHLHGRRNHEGQVWRCDPCDACTGDSICKVCNQTGLKCIAPIPVPTERAYLNLCGYDWVEPRDRE